MFCPYCSADLTNLPDDSKFCPKCGKARAETASGPTVKRAVISQINLWGSLASITAGVPAGRAWLAGIMEPSRIQSQGLSGPDKVQAVIFVGLFAAALHGILWSGVEKIFHWKYGEAEHKMPQGRAAATLSATMTVPLVVLPLIYARLTGHQIVPRGHSVAALSVIVAAALAHIFLYGVPSSKWLPGVRNVVFPADAKAKLGAAIYMEVIYAVTHFCSIVLVYRIVLAATVGPSNAAIIFPTFISAALWLSGVGVFLFLTYPDSIEDPRWVQVRGIIHGLMLTIALEGGMLM